ncbi:substrate-binding domain-containing protein [Hyphobacterium sp. HN65]|uniref:Substrate-binding domain-containing protein n=1 Tax=Hyphobacterium lacteum TaxID=3116575 RepID=A0ABU7LNR2_9PROT|nr:substrate-binding domain-containing protein [Hyphobacterium sp. HN65]MEE2525532.1 substrate-binding domain-containing protein [Hyphobacterium sp. HN65]
MNKMFFSTILGAGALAIVACSDATSSNTATTTAATGSASAATAAQSGTRNVIRIVGSSTVFPFSTAVAESFGARTSFPTPVVESTGTGGGMRLFCGGVGVDTPDLTGASRRMTPSEYELCQSNGVREIVELPIGFDGIVISNVSTGPELDISRGQIWQALAAQVPAEDCTMVDNPYTRWSEIDSSLPDLRIEVFGPPPTSGTRDAFVELAMEAGAEEIAAETGCEIPDMAMARIREDGAWIDSGENDNAIVQTLVNTPTAYGVFGYSFLSQNGDRIQGARVDGVAPEFDAIASGEYPISRSMFVYAKVQHVGVVPGIQEYLEEFSSDDAWGDFGYLTDRGLIPLPEAMRMEMSQRVADMDTMTEAPEGH